MDETDRKIVGILQSDGRISLSDLAEMLPLSPSATSDRLKRLISDKVITGFGAFVDPKALGRPIEALIDVRLSPGSPYYPSNAYDNENNTGEAWLADQPAVTNAVHLTGRFDYQLTVATKDVPELDALLAAIKENLNAEETNTKLVLRHTDGFPRAASL